MGTSRRSTSAMTVDSTKSSARPRFSPRGPIACVPPWKTMFNSVPTRFAYTSGIAFSIAGREDLVEERLRCCGRGADDGEELCAFDRIRLREFREERVVADQQGDPPD